MKDLRYLQNIAEGTATILLYDTIGEYVDGSGNICKGIDGREFAQAIEYLQGKCECIEVRINSGGGNIVEGMSIVSAILNSTVPVTTVIDGLAASMAGVIAVCGSVRKAKDYATLMVHNPHGADQKVLDVFKNRLVTILSNNSQTDENTISDLMDEETWFSAQEAKKLGLIDEIIRTKKKPTVDKTSLESMLACYNAILPKNKKMTEEKDKTQVNIEKLVENITINAENTESIKDKVSEALIDAVNEASLEEVVEQVEEVIKTNSALEELRNELNELRTSLESEKKAKEELAAKLNAIENDKELARKAQAEELVNSFLKNGKIEKTETDKFVAMALNDFDFAKSVLAKIGNEKAVKIFNAIEVQANPRDAWTIRDWEMKDSKGLLAMKNETPAIYEKLYDAFYKK